MHRPALLTFQALAEATKVLTHKTKSRITFTPPGEWRVVRGEG